MSEAASPDELSSLIGHKAARAFAQFWWAECQKIAEQVPEPSARWEIMVQALHQIGWPE